MTSKFSMDALEDDDEEPVRVVSPDIAPYKYYCGGCDGFFKHDLLWHGVRYCCEKCSELEISLHRLQKKQKDSVVPALREELMQMKELYREKEYQYIMAASELSEAREMLDKVKEVVRMLAE